MNGLLEIKNYKLGIMCCKKLKMEITNINQLDFTKQYTYADWRKRTLVD